MAQSIEDLQKAKVRLEFDVARLLYDFSEQTSVTVAGLNLERIECLGAPCAYVVSVDARL